MLSGAVSDDFGGEPGGGRDHRGPSADLRSASVSRTEPLEVALMVS